MTPDRYPTVPAHPSFPALEREVLVVDEQPRYHLSSCRALTGKATIPLPAREAVELGFTPCGWCSPVRTLAAQETATR